MHNTFKSIIKIVLPILVIIFVVLYVYRVGYFRNNIEDQTWWSMQSVDTVKYSRDLAREKATDKAFNQTIEMQIASIASIGATHVALGTPYDDEFIPFLSRWVSVARDHNLKVWFRGNLSGWEGWFDYKPITPEEHIIRIERFILQNPNLFEDGDIFTTCSECENGLRGDPRNTKDVFGYREFLIDEYLISKNAFENIGKSVQSNYFSMNADVAKLIMDKQTTARLGGVVVIDHYVFDPVKLVSDVEEIAGLSGGRIILGEMGVPIPDIHGEMDEKEQAVWLSEALHLLSNSPHLAGINYWTSYGGSTKIFRDDGHITLAGTVLNKYFRPHLYNGVIRNSIGIPLDNVIIRSPERIAKSDKYGRFSIPYNYEGQILTVSKDHYIDKSFIMNEENNGQSVYLHGQSVNLQGDMVNLFREGVRKILY